MLVEQEEDAYKAWNTCIYVIDLSLYTFYWERLFFLYYFFFFITFREIIL